jgi:hypothetical protein
MAKSIGRKPFPRSGERSRPHSAAALLWVLIPAAFVLAFSAGAVHTQTAGPEIWFGPASRYSTPDEPRPRAADLMNMFKPDAPWQNAASHIQVFRISSTFFHRLGQESNQDEVNAVVADLKRRHIAIAIEIGVINITPGSCPDKIQEGYGRTSKPSITSPRS